MIFNKNFRIKFKELYSYGSNKNFQNKIICLFENSEYFYPKAILMHYYQKWPEVIFNFDSAIQILKKRFLNNGCSIVDYTKPNLGGYPIVAKPYSFKDEESGGKSEEIGEKWNNFVQRCHDDFKEKRSSQLLSPNNDVEIYSKRVKAQSSREQMMIDNQNQFPIKGFFDLKNCSVLCKSLLDVVFNDFEYDKKLSNSKFLRYRKSIQSDLSLVLFMDLGKFKSELKRGYFELPKIDIEIIHNSLKDYISPEEYLVYQTKYPIFRVNLGYFVANNLRSFRIGYNSDESSLLKNKFIFYLAVLNYYYNIYLDELSLVSGIVDEK